MKHIEIIKEFINDLPDSVVGQYKGSTIYLWHGIYYQVILYKNITKLGSKPDHFVKRGKYAIRELSNDMLNKYKMGIDN